MVINKNISKIEKFFIEIFVGTDCMLLPCHILETGQQRDSNPQPLSL